MRGALKAYFMVMRNSMMAGLTYRAHFIFMAVGNVFYVIVSYYLWKAIYGARPDLNGLAFGQAYLQIAVSMGIFGLFQNWTEWFMSYQVQDGGIVRYLARPMDYQFNLLFDAAGGTAINFIGIAAPTIILGYALSGLPLPSPLAALGCAVAVLIAFVINFIIDFLVGLIAFVTTTVWGFSIMKEMVVLFCSGAVIPLAFFPSGARAALEWLPFQAIYSSPLAFLLRPDLTSGEVALIFARQIAWLAILLFASRLAWNAMVRRVVVNGG